MDENLLPSKEELLAEDEALKESKEEEIKNSVIEKYGLNEEDNADLIEKLTKDIIAQQKSFGKVVSQKRTWREKAIGDKKAVVKEDKKNLTEDELLLKATKLVEDKFFDRDLKQLEYSDNLKEEVKKLAKLKEISILEAKSDPYIVYLKSQEDSAEKLEKATIVRKNNGNARVIDTSKPLNPSDFDLTTKEGRDEWDKAKKARSN